ncbi:HAD family phosphatase [Saccharopolyspora taberi]|uniref:HAD family phosphatase n=1 Tax=Saccharopolyspora taberi TaxID=60895 RepID=A0ABN3VKZ9_9PSEU
MKWVVFDYGEVISEPTPALPALAGMLGVDADEFARAYYAERVAYDRGCTDLEFWHAVAAHFGAAPDDSLVNALTGHDIVGWLHIDAEAVQLIEDLDRAGVPLAVLSNAPSSFGRAVEQQPWAGHFQHLVFSGDLEVVKPDEAIYRALLDVLGARPAECLFFDDRQDNVDAAIRAGLHASIWQGAAAARRELAARGLLTL